MEKETMLVSYLKRRTDNVITINSLRANRIFMQGLQYFAISLKFLNILTYRDKIERFVEVL